MIRRKKHPVHIELTEVRARCGRPRICRRADSCGSSGGTGAWYIGLNKFNKDAERIFIRDERKYGLYEINVDEIDIEGSFDYEFVTIPPVIADRGSVYFKLEDVSLNSVWSLEKTNEDFNFDIRHFLLQIEPNKTVISVMSYSDLTSLLVQQVELAIQFYVNELLAIYRIPLAKIIEEYLNRKLEIWLHKFND